MTRERKLQFWAAGFLVFGLGVWLLQDILLPFIAGMAIAYFLDPICDRLETWGFSRTWATTLVTILFVLLVALVLILVIPAAISQVADLARQLPHAFEVVRMKLDGLLIQFETRVDPAIVERVKTGLGGWLGDFASWAAGSFGSVISGGLALVSLLSLLFLTPVVTFYLLRDWDVFIAKIDGWLPLGQAETIRKLARETDEILAGWVRGVATVCLVLGSGYAIALTAIGLDAGLLVGIVAGGLSFIPFVGSIGGFVLAMGLALVEFDSLLRILGVAAIFLVGQALEGNILTPKLVGDKVGLHPVIVIFALLAGGVLLGFTGVLIAMPVAAVIGVLARFALEHYLQSPLYRSGAVRRNEDDNPPA